MRIIASVLVLGAALVAAPALARADAPLAAALAAVPVAVLLAVLVSETAAPFAIALGALGALAHAGLLGVSPALAGGALLACAMAPRALRATSARARDVHLLAALAAGCAAAAVATHYADAALALRLAAALVAGIVGVAPLALPVDDPTAFALRSAARAVPEPACTSLLRAVFLRRRGGAAPEGLPARAERRLARAWRELVGVAQRRADARGAGAAVLDKRIAAHVEALERLYAAADERLARVAGLNDDALAAARLESDALEAEASALAEVGGAVPPSAARADAPDAPEAPVAIAAADAAR